MGSCMWNFSLPGDRVPGLGLMEKAAPSLKGGGLLGQGPLRTAKFLNITSGCSEMYRQGGGERPHRPLPFLSFPGIPTFTCVLNPSTSHGFHSRLPGEAPGSGSWASATAPLPSCPSSLSSSRSQAHPLRRKIRTSHPPPLQLLTLQCLLVTLRVRPTHLTQACWPCPAL